VRTLSLWEMFVFPFERETQAPVSVYLMHPGKNHNNMTLKNMHANFEGADHGSHMKSIEIPADLQNSPVKAIFGHDATKRTLYEMVDKNTIMTMIEGNKIGAVGFVAREKLAAVCIVPDSMKITKTEEIAAIWEFVKKVAKMH
jgi:hypothetical protein